MLTWTLRQVFKVDVFFIFPWNTVRDGFLRNHHHPSLHVMRSVDICKRHERETNSTSLKCFCWAIWQLNSAAVWPSECTASEIKQTSKPPDFLALNKTLFLILAFISSYTIKQKLFSYPQRHSWWWGNMNRCGNPFSGYLCVLKWQTQKPSTADEQDLRVTRKKESNKEKNKMK